ncbi:11406_t:CDS:2, partial [Funneliformis mosseae]
ERYIFIQILLLGNKRTANDLRYWNRQCGTSSTDLPVRTVIYPSYYQYIPSNNSRILLVSYTWKKNATKYGLYSEKEMFELALKDIPNDKTAGGGAFAEFGPTQFGELIESMMR